MTIRLTAEQKIRILNADDLFKIMQQILLREKKIDHNKEHFWLVCLSNSNQILVIELISLGSVKGTIVEPMEVFSFALQKRAVKIVMVHNHPSGELKPSRADQKLTEKMMAIGRFLDVPVIDHLIISETGFYSFEAAGLLSKIEATTNIDLTFKKQEAYEKMLWEQKSKTAKTLLKSGVSIKTIIKSTGLKLSDIEKLLSGKKS
jgi:DNA repair protein RadC